MKHNQFFSNSVISHLLFWPSLHALKCRDKLGINKGQQLGETKDDTKWLIKPVLYMWSKTHTQSDVVLTSYSFLFTATS